MNQILKNKIFKNNFLDFESLLLITGKREKIITQPRFSNSTEKNKQLGTDNQSKFSDLACQV